MTFAQFFSSHGFHVGVHSLKFSPVSVVELFYFVYILKLVLFFSDGKVTVYFVDFGNSHITNSSELLVLPDKFRELPALGIHCCLSGVGSGFSHDCFVNIGLCLSSTVSEGTKHFATTLAVNTHSGTHLSFHLSLFLSPWFLPPFLAHLHLCLPPCLSLTFSLVFNSLILWMTGI